MPNRYSQITQSQFVPTYAPPNPQMYQAAGQNLQRRQQQGLQQYDQLQETLNQLDVLPSAEPLLQEKVSEINEKLSQFSDSNDFIDAMPAIRKEARKLRGELNDGNLGAAVQSKKNAEKAFKAIEESDWSQGMKEKMKSRYLEQYENPEKGQILPATTPAEYVDIQGEISDAVKEIEETTSTTIGSIGGREAKFTSEGRPEDEIEAAVNAKINNNPKITEALRQEAEAEGLSGEEAQDYILERTQNIALEMKNKFGMKDSGVTNIDWEGDNISASTKVRPVTEPGIMQSTTAMSDVSSHLSSMLDAKKQGQTEKYNTLKQGLESTFISAVERGELSTEDYQYFKDKLDENANKLGFGLGDILGFAESGISSVTGMPVSIGGEGETDQRFQQIANKLNGFIEDGGGVVNTQFTFSNDKVIKRVHDVLKGGNSNNFEVLSTEEVEGMDEDEKSSYIKKALVDGRPEGVMFTGGSQMPYYKFRVPNEDDGYDEIFLKEKSTPNIKEAGHQTPFKEVVDYAFGNDPAANKLKDSYMLAKVPTLGDNVYEQLPPEYRQNMGSNDYIALESQEGGGVTADVGAEDNHKMITGRDMFNTAVSHFETLSEAQGSNPQVTKSYYSMIENMVNGSETLLEREKKTILENIENLNSPPEDVTSKLLEEFSVPYKFPNKTEAINIASKFTRQSI